MQSRGWGQEALPCQPHLQWLGWSCGPLPRAQSGRASILRSPVASLPSEVPSLCWPLDGSSYSQTASVSWQLVVVLPTYQDVCLALRADPKAVISNLIFNKIFWKGCSLTHLHSPGHAPLARCLVVRRSFLHAAPSRLGLSWALERGSGKSLFHAAHVNSRFSVSFLNLRQWSKCSPRLWGGKEKVPQLLPVSRSQSKRFCKILMKAGLAKLENKIICESTETSLGVSIWKNSIPSGNLADVLQFGKGNKAVFHKRKTTTGRIAPSCISSP